MMYIEFFKEKGGTDIFCVRMSFMKELGKVRVY